MAFIKIKDKFINSKYILYAEKVEYLNGTYGIKIHLSHEVICNLYDNSDEMDLDYNRLFDNLT
jgi:hypothetical protein